CAGRCGLGRPAGAGRHAELASHIAYPTATMTDEAQWARAGRGSPVHARLAPDAAVLPFLDRNLGRVDGAPLRVVDVDPPDHECPVARDHIAVVGESSHG